MEIKEMLKKIANRIIDGNVKLLDFLMSVGFYATIITVVVSSWLGSFTLLQMFIGPALVFTLYQGIKLGVRQGREYLHGETIKAVTEIINKMNNGK